MKVAAFDVSKDALDWSHSGSVRKSRNSVSEIHKLLAGLEKDTAIAMESTGPYHLELARAACKRGHPTYVVNARRFYSFKKSEAVRGKTDRLDSQVLELYVMEKHERLHPFQMPSKEIESLRELVVRRETLVEAKTMILLSLAGAEELAIVSKDLKAALQKALKFIDRRIAELLTKFERAPLLLGIPGIGPLSTAGLLSLLERFDFASSDAFVAYLGLDPRANDSGRKKGRRFISCEGDSTVRRLLYACALSASRTSAWKPYYKRQLEKGLSTTESLLVLARKMARAAWSMHKHRTPFHESRVDKIP
jgi:transposase